MSLTLFMIHMAIELLNGIPLLPSPADLQIYSDAVAAKGASLNDCFGFIDGTVRPICRPGEQQRIL